MSEERRWKHMYLKKLPDEKLMDKKLPSQISSCTTLCTTRKTCTTCTTLCGTQIFMDKKITPQNFKG